VVLLLCQARDNPSRTGGYRRRVQRRSVIWIARRDAARVRSSRSRRRATACAPRRGRSCGAIAGGAGEDGLAHLLFRNYLPAISTCPSSVGRHRPLMPCPHERNKKCTRSELQDIALGELRAAQIAVALFRRWV